MIAALLQEHGAGHGTQHAHEPPWSVFKPVWQWFVKTFPDLSRSMGFDNPDRNLGQFWFEAIAFSLVACGILVFLAWASTRKYERVPRGLQNLLEWGVQAIRNMVGGVIPHGGDKYVPFLGTLFLFIFMMNMLGVIPAFRAPTMTISTTAAMGLTAIVLVQWYTIRDAGLKNVIKHLMGPVAVLAPLMLPVEIISELVRPVSLSLRLYGNIFGEDNIIEQLMGLGGGIPVQLPMMALALFTSFLQAYIFTMLCTIYIAGKVVHDEEHGHEEGHGSGHEAAHAAGSH